MQARRKAVWRRFGVLGVILYYALARVVPGWAVNRLIDALASADEDTSMGAYMVLVKLGPRVAHRLLDAARQGQQTSSLLRVLADQGEPSVIPELER